ncbi:hypothetical protein GF406_11865 [candidate division KSB1 bacterium]|nr:hypothetical protein [candidate division KSB1 bacterium]
MGIILCNYSVCERIRRRTISPNTNQAIPATIRVTSPNELPIGRLYKALVMSALNYTE